LQCGREESLLHHAFFFPVGRNQDHQFRSSDVIDLLQLSTLHRPMKACPLEMRQPRQLIDQVPVKHEADDRNKRTLLKS
jgi:hypothetical protein